MAGELEETVEGLVRDHALATRVENLEVNQNVIVDRINSILMRVDNLEGHIYEPRNEGETLHDIINDIERRLEIQEEMPKAHLDQVDDDEVDDYADLADEDFPGPFDI